MKLIANLSEIDRRATQEHGIPAELLMENAGTQVADWFFEQKPACDQRIVILCGPGNNGGDGFVVARLLHRNGYTKVSCLYTGKNYRHEALTNLEQLMGMPVELIQAHEQPALAKSRLENADWIIDGLFGSGLGRPIEGLEAELITLANRCRACGNLNGIHPHVLAIDIPSGVDGATGAVLNVAIEADATVTFGTAKPGLFLQPGKRHSSEVHVADIGLPRSLLETEPSPVQLISSATAREWLPKRPSDGHKYSFGHVLIVGGSRNMPGAMALMAHAALSAGAGLVTVAAPRSVFESQAFWPELLRLPLPENSDGCLSESAWWPVVNYLQERAVDTIGIGPGLGQHSDTVQFVWKLLGEIIGRERPLPLIIDADALNALSLVDDVEYLRDVKRPVLRLNPQTILTPHIGEASRLLKADKQSIQQDLLRATNDLRETWSANVVLKSASTVAATRHAHQGSDLWISPTGNSGMATAGSGDVLAGIICGLAAQLIKQNRPVEWAAPLGVYLHGLAGDLAAEQHSEYALRASHITEALGSAFLQLELPA